MQQKIKAIGEAIYYSGNPVFYKVMAPITFLVILYGCQSSSAGKETGYQPQTQNLPVFTVITNPATTYQEYSASLEGSRDIEVRPQVEGNLDKIYVDEGAYVHKGQPLFHIYDLPFREQLNTAKAGLAAARANLATAEINVAKITPLVEHKVVAEVQLKSAQSAYNAAQANVAQSQAMVGNAEVNFGFTQINAPVDGYIGRIPHKTGSLVGMTTTQPLTVISEIKDVFAYFSLSEPDYLRFKNQFSGKTIAEKIKQMPPVELLLADNSVYPQKGKVEIASGQFNNSMGAISFRARFPNTDGLLRSGNTGKLRIPKDVSSAIIIPQEATYELQDKVFVFLVGDSNKVASKPITIGGKAHNYYIVQDGLKPGDKIVYSGLDRLQDGAVINPQPMSLDSLLKVRPF